MIEFLFLLIFVFAFWAVHVVRRVFANTYLWQIKEYRVDRILAHLNEKNLLSKKSFPTIISITLLFSGILLLKFLSCRILYGVLVIGFAYYVYSALATITKFLNKKLTCPAKRLRNLLVIGGVMILSLIALVIPYLFYISYFQETARDSIASEAFQIFPKEGDDGFLVIPLETASVVLFFVSLFVFDFLVPALVALIAVITTPLAALYRKKK